MEKQMAHLDFTAYIPCYDGGNCVTGVLRDGSTVKIDMSIRSVLGRLLKEHNLDMGSLKKNFSGYISRTHLFPVPLGIDTVLIPVKVRKTIAVNDGAFAYIDLSFIEKISREKRVTIWLKCGYEVTCLENIRTINQRINKGIVIKEKFASIMLGGLNLMEGISKIGTEYQRPATKGDITILAYEIMKLRKSLDGETPLTPADSFSKRRGASPNIRKEEKR